MNSKLNGKHIAILVMDGFEQVELTGPKEALEKAGAEVDIISPAGESVRAWDFTKWGKTFRVDVQLKKARTEDYDALMLPVA
jgi:protease I